MPSPEDVRRKCVSAAARLLVELLDEGAPGDPVSVEVTDGAWAVRVEVGSRTAAGNGQPGSSRVAGPHLTKLDRQILGAATPQWQTKAQLADACDHHDLDSYFADRVRRLTRSGLLESAGDGQFRLPN